MTVEQANPNSHKNKGWETFTDRVITILNNNFSNIVFLLWGNYAQTKCQNIDRDKHCVMHAVHPSPLSAYRGFLGCQHFSKTNTYLLEHGKSPIQWQL